MHPASEHGLQALGLTFAFSDVAVNGLYSTGGVAALIMAGVALVKALNETLKLVPAAVRAIRAAWSGTELPPEPPTPAEPPLPTGPDLDDLPPGPAPTAGGDDWNGRPIPGV